MLVILGIAGALLGALFGEGGGLVIGAGLGMLLGWAIKREQRRAAFLEGRAGAAKQRPTVEAELAELKGRVERLERALFELRSQGAPAQTEPTAAPSPQPEQSQVETQETFEQRSALQPAPTATPPTDKQPTPEQVPSAQLPSEPFPPEPSYERSPEPVPPRQVPEPAIGDRTLEALRSFLFGGNTVVRIGILVLTVGIGLLAKYAAEHAILPVEVRLAFAASLGIALIVLGYRLRARRGYGSALSGGGIAALYLVTFFAYYAYQLVPAPLTMGLLVAIALFSAVLAVAQDAQELAVFGAIGGFLAPVLASRGGGSHIALFSYYALLNAQISGTALFRSWRFLNWTGFLFTFGIAATWGTLRYEPAHMASAGGFLALFFAFYLANGTLFALKQSGDRRGIIDTTLTFGTPLATLIFAGGLFRLEHLYLALACVLLSAAYLLLSWRLLSRREDALRPLAQAYLAIGIGVATLAVPFGLSNALATALAWTVEACGLLWVGLTQARLRARVFGYLLYVAALAALLQRLDHAGDAAGALFCALIAIGFGFGAAHVARRRDRVHDVEQVIGHALLGTGLLLWRAALHFVTSPSITPYPVHDLALLTLAAASVFALDLVGAAWPFSAARAVARFALPYFLLSLLPALDTETHLFAGFAWIGWSLAVGAAYLVLSRQREVLDAAPRLRDALHASGGWLVAGLAVAEMVGLTKNVLSLSEGFTIAFSLGGALAACTLALRGLPRWPVAAYPRAYLRGAALPIAVLVCLTLLLVQFESDGSAAPLPYFPLLNPLDLVQAFALVLLLFLGREALDRSARSRRFTTGLIVLATFVALNGTVVRTVHHWLGTPFERFSIPDDSTVQSGFSILWTALSLIAMFVAHRRGLRGVWIGGATLLGVVVVKLFASDLDNLGSIAKIITFLAVGVLLLLIGYVAPVPPKPREEKS